MASVTFDSKYNILYFRFSFNKAVNAIPLTHNQHLDVDKAGQAVGIEIMLPDSIPVEATEAILRLKEKKRLTREELMASTVLKNLISQQGRTILLKAK